MITSWKNWGSQLALASCVIVGGAIASANCALAQITPDSTLPNNSRVTTQDNIRIIEGGTQAGGNLFHSFQQFSVPTGSEAYFNNTLDIQNIISRVTGSSISNIDGLIRANGTANLFLINPTGIIFGPNASLNIGGSFLATTANSLKFPDGTQFSATAPQTTPLLTISVPIGLQFGENAGSIRNQSQISDRNGERVGLQVKSGKSLALVGGEVALEGGTLTTPGGRIELGSVAGSGLVTLNPTNKGWTLGYEGIQNFQNIDLSQYALVDASGKSGGDIHVQGKLVRVTDGSQIAAKTLGSGLGGNLVINASEEVIVSGESVKPQDKNVSRLTTRTEASGSGGNLTITTGKFFIQGGAQVSAGTQGSGSGGTLTVNASEEVQISGASANGEILSRLTTRTESGGTAGNMIITSGKLLIRNGGQVSTGALDGSTGAGGSLTVNAKDSVEVSGFIFIPDADSEPVFSRLTTRTEGDGTAGNMTITTGKLLVRNGGQVSTGTVGGSTGAGGSLTINAKDSVEVSGFIFIPDANSEPTFSRITTRTRGDGTAGDMVINTNKLVIWDGGQVSAGTLPTSKGNGGNLTINAADSVQVIGTAANIPGEPVRSRLTNRTENDLSTGNLRISTGKLIVRDGAEVSVNSLRGSAQAGNLHIKARSIQLENEATLNARAKSADGGNITLQLQDLLLLRRNSQISATAGITQGSGNGGNITINAPNGFIVAVPNENSDIAANAFTGSGGKVEITAQGIFGLTPRTREELETLLGTQDPNQLNPARLPSSDITAISRINPSLSGQVIINTPDVDPSRGLVNLPAVPVDTQVAQGCTADGSQAQSEFIITGRGGLPPNPGEALNTDVVQVDLVTLNPEVIQSSTTAVSNNPTTPTPARIVEATGWVIDADGNVVLTANAPTVTPHSSWQRTADCRAFNQLPGG
ncbi:filamentous hemagglutinin N-terminal domain-containing protein [Scytonema sp. PCC 10023]|uniref:two-partner secretion domain-containing protein n=1 Tax=Scytonema sp. PCC 10023 TaxID=1680591 RepID=UPI0039C72EF6